MITTNNPDLAWARNELVEALAQAGASGSDIFARAHNTIYRAIFGKKIEELRAENGVPPDTPPEDFLPRPKQMPLLCAYYNAAYTIRQEQKGKPNHLMLETIHAKAIFQQKMWSHVL
jgi:hypothetical protein